MAAVTCTRPSEFSLILNLPIELIFTFPLQALARLACCCSYLAESLQEQIEAARRPTLLQGLAKKVPSFRVSAGALSIEWDAMRVAGEAHPPSAPPNASLGSRLMWDRAALDAYELEEAAAAAWDNNGRFVAHGFSVVGLSGNPIGRRGVQALCPVIKAMGSSLCDLQLQACAIDDHCVVVLCNALQGVHNGALQRLWLGSNDIGDGGCGAIVSALEHSAALSRSLQVLSLGDNRIGDVGAHALAAAIAAGRMQNGKQLWIAGNPHMTIAGQAALARACVDWGGFLQLITTVHVEM